MLVSTWIPQSTSSPWLALISSSVGALGTEGKSWGLARVSTGSSPTPLPACALQIKDAKFIEWQLMISEELRPICRKKEPGRMRADFISGHIRLLPLLPAESLKERRQLFVKRFI